MKHEENGLISSAAVVSAVSENADDTEFRKQEIFCQLFLFQYLFYIIYGTIYQLLYGDSDKIHLVPTAPDFDVQKNMQVLDINRKAQYLAGTRTSISI